MRRPNSRNRGLYRQQRRVQYPAGEIPAGGAGRGFGQRPAAANRDAELVGYSSRPEASDLVLSPQMRQYVADSQPLATEWKSGQILVTSIAQVRLNPAKRDGSRIFYLMEAYTTASDSGTMQVTIRDSAGKQVVQTPPARVQLGAGGGVLRGQLNLEGLPPGQYGLTVAVKLGGVTTERTAGFTMSDLQTELNRQAALAQADRITDEGYFRVMGEEELDQAEEPLEYIAESRELRSYRGATVEAKRRFLVDFWRRRDPDPATPRNELREEFYGKIAYADTNFRERGAGTTPGWKTDRGRVYAKYGAPNEVLDRERRGRTPAVSGLALYSNAGHLVHIQRSVRARQLQADPYQRPDRSRVGRLAGYPGPRRRSRHRSLSRC